MASSTITSATLAIIRAKVRQVWRSSIAAGMADDLEEDCCSRVVEAVWLRMSSKGIEGGDHGVASYAVAVARNVVTAMRESEGGHERISRQLAVTLGVELPSHIDITEPVRDVDQRVRDAMADAGGSVPDAAKALGVSRRTVERSVRGSNVPKSPRGPKKKSGRAA
ncbi:MAG: hypothetical protein NVS3B10_00600 [Polyangiales bacterium]